MDPNGYGAISTYTVGMEKGKWWKAKSEGVCDKKVQKCFWNGQKVFVLRPSQCIYRMVQGFWTHGNDRWYFIVHGIYLWFFTHSHFRVFLSFLERVRINHNKFSTSLHLWGRNNNVLDHIWWNFSCEGQNGWNNGGNMMYNYGLDHKELGEQFLVLTLPMLWIYSIVVDFFVFGHWVLGVTYVVKFLDFFSVMDN